MQMLQDGFAAANQSTSKPRPPCVHAELFRCGKHAINLRFYSATQSLPSAEAEPSLQYGKSWLNIMEAG